MRTSRAKQLIGAGLMVAAVVVVGVISAAIAAVVLRSGTGADPADAFSQISPIPEDLGELVVWEPDQRLARAVEPTTRQLVEAAWVRSWSRVDTAQRTGDRELIDTWFMGALADQVAESAATGSLAGVQQLGHSLEVTFYSVDGSIMTLNATSDLERSVQAGPSLVSRDQYEVVMLLSDGNWRVLRLTRLKP